MYPLLNSNKIIQSYHKCFYYKLQKQYWLPLVYAYYILFVGTGGTRICKGHLVKPF